MAKGCREGVTVLWKCMGTFDLINYKPGYKAGFCLCSNRRAVVAGSNFSWAGKQSTRALYELVNRARLDRGTRHFGICAEYNGRLSHQDPLAD